MTFVAGSTTLVSPPRRSILAETLFVITLYFAFTAYLTWPLLPKMGNHTIPSGDYYLTTYIQAWVAHAIVSHPTQLFNMNMLYPAKNVLAGSENLIGNQAIFGPIYLASQNPAMAANVVTFASFWLCGLAMYALVRRITRDAILATVAGFIYAFSPPRMAQIAHSQLLSMQWIPLAVLFLVLFLLQKRVSSLLSFSIFLLLQVLCSLYLGYIALLICGAFFVSVLTLHPDVITRRTVLGLIVSGGLLAALVVPLMQPYRHFQKETESSALDSFSTSVAASATPFSSYLNIGGGAVSRVYRQLLGNVRSGPFNWEKTLFPGFLPLALSVLGAGYVAFLLLQRENELQLHAVRILGEAGGSLALGAGLVVASSYILSLGPYLWMRGRLTHIRLPFYWLRLWVPGLKLYRVPARFGLATTFGVAILCAYGFLALLTFLSRWHLFRTSAARVVVAALTILMLTVEFRSSTRTLQPVMTKPDLAPEYSWLARQPPNSPTVELPITVQGQDTDPAEEATYAYASTFHWQPLVNGYTGHIPAESANLLLTASRLPASDAILAVANAGVHYIVVHLNRLSPIERTRWKHIRSNIGLAMVKDFGNSVVYSVARNPTSDPEALWTESACTDDQYLASTISGVQVLSSVRNSGFENGSLEPWRKFQTVTAFESADRAHRGRHSLAESAEVGSVYQDISGLVPGANYTFLAWVSGSHGATATAQMAIYDPSTEHVEFSSTVSGCDQFWKPLSMTVAPGKNGILRVHLFRNQGSGTIYWDDLEMYRK